MPRKGLTVISGGLDIEREDRIRHARFLSAVLDVYQFLDPIKPWDFRTTLALVEAHISIEDLARQSAVRSEVIEKCLLYIHNSEFNTGLPDEVTRCTLKEIITLDLEDRVKELLDGI